MNIACYCVTVSAKEQRACCDVDYVKVLASGLCVWFLEFELSVSHCPMDITWFPFDEQSCPLIYESKRYESRELNVTAQQRAADLQYSQSSSEWNVIGMFHRRLKTFLRKIVCT